ncbi:MAG: MFS transporter [Gemella sp.]|nr:MFS transporter [Gemella sp.]
MNKTLSKNLYSFYFSNVLISLSKALPHSILTILFLDKGLSLSNIMIVQAMFSLAILVFEVPSGVWSDLHSRKSMYILYNILLIIVFLMIIYFNSFYLMALIWFIYGLAESVNSGTLDAQIINDIKGNFKNKVEQEKYINKFIKFSSQSSLVFVILGSTIGSFLYFKIGVNMYYLAIVMVVTSILIVTTFFKETVEKEHKEKSTIKEHIKLSLEELTKSRELRILFILSVVGQIFFQTHYQLWQALFLSKNWADDKLYILYILFQIIGIVAFWVPIRNVKNRTILTVSLISLVLPILLILGNKYWVLVFYLLLVLIFSVIDYILTNVFANKVSTDNISSLLSMRSSLTRVSSMLILLVSGMLLKYMEVNYLVIGNFLLSILIIIVILVVYNRKNNAKD